MKLQSIREKLMGMDKNMHTINDPNRRIINGIFMYFPPSNYSCYSFFPFIRTSAMPLVMVWIKKRTESKKKEIGIMILGIQFGTCMAVDMPPY